MPLGRTWGAQNFRGGGNDQFTKILLHFDGVDGSTDIHDHAFGGSQHVWTALGNAQIDTGITDFGSPTLLCDGVGDAVSTPDHADFTLGDLDWAAECRFNTSGGSGTVRRMWGQQDSAVSAASSSIICAMRAIDVLRCQAHVGATVITVDSTTPITTPGWHHMMFFRNGGILGLFVDGVLEGTNAISGAINDSSNAWAVGRQGEATGSTWLGSFNEFRLSVGTCRENANHTPPTMAYS